MIVNSWNSPRRDAAGRPSAVQSISVTASVMSPSSVMIGLASFVVVSVNVQPGIGCTSTDAIGVSVGSCSFSPVVLAVSLSVGTRKLIIWSLPPRVAPGAIDRHVRRRREGDGTDGGPGAAHGEQTARRRMNRPLSVQDTIAAATVESNSDVRTLKRDHQAPAAGSSTLDAL